MEKHKVVVRLMGHEYTLVTDQPDKEVQRMARYVDRRMREIALTTRAGETVTPLLTALTLAGELFSAQAENTRLKRELAARERADDAPVQES